MIKWLVNFFRPKKIFIVYNEEAHVGCFFQAAFYDRNDAIDYVAARIVKEQRDTKELAKFMELEVAEGRYPAELYDPSGMMEYTLELSIEEYDISAAGWIDQRKKMLQPSAK